MLNKMGNCQSIALKIFIHDLKGGTIIHKFTMDQMRTFRTIGEVFSLIQLHLEPTDKIYYNSHVGLQEVLKTDTFQIRDLIIKNSKIIRYRIVMEQTY
jgi:hypothetical protein